MRTWCLGPCGYLPHSSPARSAEVWEAPARAVPRQSSADSAPECPVWLSGLTSKDASHQTGPRGKWSFSIDCAYQHYEIMLKLPLPGTDAILENKRQHFYNWDVQCHDQVYSKVTLLSWKVFSLKVWCPSQVPWPLQYYLKGGSKTLFIWVKSPSPNRWVNWNNCPRDLLEFPPLKVF